jgi:trans-aconitate 2-methyltransferase
LTAWNPSVYRQFEDERSRPAKDLLARVWLDAPANIVDLGCGPGNSTELLAAQFPAAAVLGIDTSEQMLANARERLAHCRFEQADIAAWRSEAPCDLIFANASLQWVAQHERLFPALFGQVAPGGVLAVQMPDAREEPAHRLMRQLAAEAPWAETIGAIAASRVKILPLTAYYDILTPQAAGIEVWRTTYFHPMASAAAILNWVRGTALRPFIDPLPPAQRTAFLAEYESRLAAAYPAREDGRRLLAFPRIFMIARRKG